MTGQVTSPSATERQRPGLQRDREVAALATRQHGVVARRQLLAIGLKADAIEHRLKAKRLHPIHRGVYALGHTRLSRRGIWLAAVLACGEGALLSHRSAAALWGLMRAAAFPVDVSSMRGRGRQRISVHEGRIHREDRAAKDSIPVTSVARTLLDLADVLDEVRVTRAFEEADRLGLLELRAFERVCDRAVGRRGVAVCRRLVAAAKAPATTRSPLENRFATFCDEMGLPAPASNVLVLDHEVDALWPKQRLIVELDGFAFHRHRAAFERDRARDAALQAAGYRVIRLTDRRIEAEATTVATELRRLLS